MKSVGHGLVDHSAVYEPDEDDVAARRQLPLEELERAKGVLVEGVRRRHLGERIRAHGADVVACESRLLQINIVSTRNYVFPTYERVEDDGWVVGELAAGHAQLIALRRVAVGAVPCEVLKSDSAGAEAR